MFHVMVIIQHIRQEVRTQKLDYIEKIKFFGGLMALLALIEQKMMEVNVTIIIIMHVLLYILLKDMIMSQ